MGSGRELDGLARDLASGQISRRAALGRLAGAAAGVTIASIPGASALASRSKKCPKSRRCGEKCCPKHAKCKHGKCKCVAGYSKCGKKCFDLQTSPKHCGDCDIACADGEVCSNGACMSLQTCGNDQIEGNEVCDGTDLGGEDCVSQGFLAGTLTCNPNCMAFDTSNCVDAICGDGIVGPGEECDDGNFSDGDGCSSNCTVEPGWQCVGEPSACSPVCGDGLIVGGEACDGDNLNGETCESLGAQGGNLACSDDCKSFDATDCFF